METVASLGVLVIVHVDFLSGLFFAGRFGLPCEKALDGSDA
jgi:hypothetical protein